MRRYSDIPLPAEPYRPGTGAIHPRRRPPGTHLPDLPVGVLDAADWHRSPRYLYAADLFNNGYWWEVHEVLEALWLPLVRTSETARFLQSLILSSAALLKFQAGETRAALALLGRARERLAPCASPRFGLDAHALLDDVAAHFAGRDGPPPRLRLSGGCVD